MLISNFCKDEKLLNLALSHPSSGTGSYERLEFLGDAVLKIIISDFLYKTFPNVDEGVLTKYRAIIVSDKTLAEFAKKINLGNSIILGTKVKILPSILACAFEAVLGAIYLNSGLNTAFDFVINNFKDEILTFAKNAELANPKALLQEYTQSCDNKLPNYILKNESGLSHDKTFMVDVYYNGEFLGSGSGKSKKEAEQSAAKAGLIKKGIIR